MSWWNWASAGAALLGGASSYFAGRDASKANAIEAQSRSEWAEWNYEQDTKRTLFQADTTLTRSETQRGEAELERGKAGIAQATAGLTRDQSELLNEQADFAGIRAAEAMRIGQLGATLKRMRGALAKETAANELSGITSAFEANDAAERSARARLGNAWASRNQEYEDAIADVEVGAATVGVAGATVAAVGNKIRRRQARDREAHALEDASIAARSRAERSRLRARSANLILSSAFQQRYNELLAGDDERRGTVAASGIELEGSGLRLRGLGAILDARKYDLAHGAHTLASRGLEAQALMGERAAGEAVEGLNTRPAVLDYAGLARQADSGWGQVGTFLSGAASGASLLMTGRELWEGFRSG